MDYERNRSRITQLTDMGARLVAGGYRINSPSGDYIISTENITHMHDGAWEIMIAQLPTHQTDQEAFDSYIKLLNDIKAPVLSDARLSEMVAIIDNVITEYTKYVQEELAVKEPLCYHIQRIGRMNRDSQPTKITE